MFGSGLSSTPSVNATNSQQGTGANLNVQPTGSASSLFGSTSSGPSSSFGGFGSFGSGSSATGQPATSSGSFSFGSTAAQPSTPFSFGAATTNQPTSGSALSGFGQSTFGSQPTQPSSSSTGFGQPQSTAAGFGQPSSTGLFGKPAGTSLFPTQSGFGAGQPANQFGSFGTGGAFGQQTGFTSSTSTPSTSSFGSAAKPATPGMFGTPGGFFSQSIGTPTTGTGNPPYSQTSDVESDKTVYLQSISAMPPFRTKSQEELRWEDYQRGNKFAGFPSSTSASIGQPSSGGFGGQSFGASQSGAFGASQPAAFGSGQPTAFGTPQSNAFGTATSQPSLFGANQPGTLGSQTSSLFGAKPAAPFGATPSSFGTTASSPFGSQPASTPFGSQSTSTPFGSQSTSTPFGGQPAATSFGTSTTSTPFGTVQAAPFGSQPTTSTTSSFTLPTQSFPPTQPPASTSLFGGKSFGQPAAQPPVPSLFGSGTSSSVPAVQPPSLFTPTTGTGLFSQPAASTATLSTPSLTTPATTATGLFGQAPAATPFSSAFKPSFPSSGSTSALLPQKQQLSIDSSPYGPTTNFPAISTSLVAPAQTLPVTEFKQQQQSPLLRKTPIKFPKSFVKFKPPRTAADSQQPTSQESTFILDNLLRNKDQIKKLVIEFESKPSPENRFSISHQEHQSVNGDGTTSDKGPATSSKPTYGDEQIALDSEQLAQQGHYYSDPPISRLKRLDKKELSSISDFRIGRKGIGLVEFLVPVDLSTTPLDQIFGCIVQFSSKQISLYSESILPSDIVPAGPGTGLNVPARVTLYGCWPVDPVSKGPICQNIPEDLLKKHLRKLALVEDCDFVDFEPRSGAWIFRVNHF